MPLKLKKRHGSANWYVTGTVAGRTIDKSTGTPDRRLADEYRSRIEADLYASKIYGEAATATFAEAVISYIENGGSKRFLDPLVTHFGVMKLNGITQRAIDGAARKLYPGRSKATLNRQAYGPVSAVLKHAASRGMCAWLRVERQREPKGVVRWLRPEEAKRLIGVAPSHLRLILLFLFHTGARVGEALKLNWQEIDLQARTVTFVGSNTKTGETRTVPLSPELIVALAAQSRQEGIVLRRPDGKPYALKRDAGGQFKTAFRSACMSAGIKNFRPHDTRHTWATWHYQMNRDLIALKVLGGWHTDRSVMRYAHADADRFQESMSRLPSLTSARF